MPAAFKSQREAPKAIPAYVLCKAYRHFSSGFIQYTLYKSYLTTISGVGTVVSSGHWASAAVPAAGLPSLVPMAAWGNNHPGGGVASNGNVAYSTWPCFNTDANADRNVSFSHSLFLDTPNVPDHDYYRRVNANGANTANSSSSPNVNLDFHSRPRQQDPALLGYQFSSNPYADGLPRAQRQYRGTGTSPSPSQGSFVGPPQHISQATIASFLRVDPGPVPGSLQGSFVGLPQQDISQPSLSSFVPALPPAAHSAPVSGSPSASVPHHQFGQGYDYSGDPVTSPDNNPPQTHAYDHQARPSSNTQSGFQQYPVPAQSSYPLATSTATQPQSFMTPVHLGGSPLSAQPYRSVQTTQPHSIDDLHLNTLATQNFSSPSLPPLSNRPSPVALSPIDREMPPSSTRRRPTNRAGTADLTKEEPTGPGINSSVPSATMPVMTRMRSVADVTDSSSRKRRSSAAALPTVRPNKTRRNGPRSSQSHPLSDDDVFETNDRNAPETIDLSNATEVPAECLAPKPDNRVKLGKFQCVICMDDTTGLTVTHCGHLFCSMCLHSALMIDTIKRTCPVCRSKVELRDKKGRTVKSYYPLELKIMTATKMEGVIKDFHGLWARGSIPLFYSPRVSISRLRSWARHWGEDIVIPRRFHGLYHSTIVRRFRNLGKKNLRGELLPCPAKVCKKKYIPPHVARSR
ncbi:hypothetical protein F4777DRAFT_288834 [Nemania sp. FL0916]|nr:hypothetical protein F4777DRAFT_288834 [Nemania sp. FL0916]